MSFEILDLERRTRFEHDLYGAMYRFPWLSLEGRGEPERLKECFPRIGVLFSNGKE